MHICMSKIRLPILILINLCMCFRFLLDLLVFVAQFEATANRGNGGNHTAEWSRYL